MDVNKQEKSQLHRNLIRKISPIKVKIAPDANGERNSMIFHDKNAMNRMSFNQELQKVLKGFKCLEKIDNPKQALIIGDITSDTITVLVNLNACHGKLLLETDNPRGCTVQDLINQIVAFFKKKVPKKIFFSQFINKLNC